MKVRLIEKEEGVKFNFIKQVIQKDLEVYFWCNRLSETFGEVKIYSDYSFELNCFDQCLSLLIDREIDFSEDSAETALTSYCTEYIFNLCLQNSSKVKVDTNELTDKFTRYLFEASEIIISSEVHLQHKTLDVLTQKYFPGFHPNAWRYLNPNFLEYKI